MPTIEELPDEAFNATNIAADDEWDDESSEGVSMPGSAQHMQLSTALDCGTALAEETTCTGQRAGGATASGLCLRFAALRQTTCAGCERSGGET